MSWVEWIKGLAERRSAPANATATATHRLPTSVRRPRKGGQAYAREWVKVLEDNTAERDPASTYTWELGSEPARPRPRAAGTEAPASPEFDTYSWELQEGSSPDDPWGLKEENKPVHPTSPKDGINPYDTGVFDATWTGKFDRR
jgi:hypothetical protein